MAVLDRTRLTGGVTFFKFAKPTKTELFFVQTSKNPKNQFTKLILYDKIPTVTACIPCRGSLVGKNRYLHIASAESCLADRILFYEFSDFGH